MDNSCLSGEDVETRCMHEQVKVRNQKTNHKLWMGKN